MRHPLRKFEVYNKFNENKIFFMFFNNIYNLFISRFEWKNLPKEIPGYMIEEFLFWRGSCLFLYDDVAESYAVMRTALTGDIDIYDTPNDRQAYAPNYVEEYYKDNSVVVWNNPVKTGFCVEAEVFAESLENAWRTKNLNMFSQRNPVVIASSQDEKLSFEILGKNYENYVPIWRIKDSLDLEKIKVLNLNSPYVVDKIEFEIREIMSRVLTMLGYNNNPVEKKERLVSDEISGNNGEIEANRLAALCMRKRACEAINSIFGLNVDVEFRSEIPLVEVQNE